MHHRWKGLETIGIARRWHIFGCHQHVGRLMSYKLMNEDGIRGIQKCSQWCIARLKPEVAQDMANDDQERILVVDIRYKINLTVIVSLLLIAPLPERLIDYPIRSPPLFGRVAQLACRVSPLLPPHSTAYVALPFLLSLCEGLAALALAGRKAVGFRSSHMHNRFPKILPTLPGGRVSVNVGRGTRRGGSGVRRLRAASCQSTVSLTMFVQESGLRLLASLREIRSPESRG
jgi:hypothetical protein